MNRNELGITAHQVSQQSSQEIKDGFAVRKKLLNRILSKLKETNREDAIQHRVFVGGRGSGKSTILNRIKVEFDDSEKYIAIYLPEEQPGLYRLFDLWLAVIEELEAKGHDIQRPVIEDYNADLSYLSKSIYYTIRDYLLNIDKQLILLIDNIDRVFKNIDEEKSLLRELLLNHKDLVIIGGSTEMSEDFWDYKDPFYQFFKIERLEGLSKKEVKHLLEHWSKVNGIESISQLLKTNPGKIEAIRVMTGGNPRTMLLFINMLVNHNDAQGFDYLKRIIDKTTPIYQERLQQISAQQRKIVAELSFLWKPSTVEELVHKCLMPSKQISAQLSKLEKTRIVESIKLPKSKKRYRLKERLFNLYLIMTQAGSVQKKRAKYLTEFLELWYDGESIQDYYQNTINSLNQDNAGSHVLARVKALAHSRHISMNQRDDLLAKVSGMKCWSFADLSMLPEKSQEILHRGQEAYNSGHYKKVISLLLQLEQPDGTVFYNLGLAYSKIDDFVSSEKYYLMAIGKGNEEAMYNYAYDLSDKGKFEESKKYYLMAVEQGHVKSMCNYAYDLSQKGRFKEAEPYYLMAIEKEDVTAMHNYAYALSEKGRFEESEKYYLMAIDKGYVNSMVNYANYLSEEGRIEASEKYYLMAIDKGHSNAMYNYANDLSKRGRFEESEQYYLMAIEKGQVNAMYNYANDLSKEGRFEESEKYYLMAIGKGHVDSIFNYAIDLYDAGRLEDSYKYFLLYSSQDGSSLIEQVISFYYLNNEIQRVTQLMKECSDKKISPVVQNYTDLWLGNMSDYESKREEVLQNAIDQENVKEFIEQNLIHLQSSWIVDQFNNNEELRNVNEPLYYAALILNGNIKDLNYEIPEAMIEVVEQILQYVNERREVYYPSN